MKIRNWIRAMIVGVLVFTLIPVHNVMAEEDSEQLELKANSIEQDLYNSADDGEPEIALPATENEYLISDGCSVMEDMRTRAILLSNVSFERSKSSVATAAITVKGTSNITKIESAVYLLRKEGNSYDYIGKKSLKSIEGTMISHIANFSIEKKEEYQIKVVITEYRGNKKDTKPAIYKKLS